MTRKAAWWARCIEAATLDVEIAQAFVDAVRSVAERYPQTFVDAKLERAEDLLREHEADLADTMDRALADGYRP